MVANLGLYSFLVVYPVCDLDEGVVGPDVGCIFGCLGTGVDCIGCLGVSLEYFVVVEFLL